MSNEINPMAFFQEPSVADLRLLACPGAEELVGRKMAEKPDRKCCDE